MLLGFSQAAKDSGKEGRRALTNEGVPVRYHFVFNDQARFDDQKTRSPDLVIAAEVNELRQIEGEDGQPVNQPHWESWGYDQRHY